MLYPIKFEPILKSLIWGGSQICEFKEIEPIQDGIGESWEISSVEGNISVVSNGELKGRNLSDIIGEYQTQLLGKKNYERFGDTFPLLIKFIDAKDNLSIQVHPDDELAKKRHNSFGKTEMWYVIGAADNASLYSGFRKQLTSEEYVKSIEENTFMDYLEGHSVKAGDVFFLPAGRVHAIGAGTFVAEIQQTSNITYRIYDYKRVDANGKERELHTELAKDAIDYRIYEKYRTKYTPVKDQAVFLESNQYFTTNLFELDKPIERDYSAIDSFIVYIFLDGGATIEDNMGNVLEVKQGESVLIPAVASSIIITPKENVKLLETYV